MTKFLILESILAIAIAIFFYLTHKILNLANYDLFIFILFPSVIYLFNLYCFKYLEYKNRQTLKLSLLEFIILLPVVTTYLIYHQIGKFTEDHSMLEVIF